MVDAVLECGLGEARGGGKQADGTGQAGWDGWWDVTSCVGAAEDLRPVTLQVTHDDVKELSVV